MSAQPTEHAVLRWLQRINPTEATPRQSLTDAYERARLASRDDVPGKTYVDDETDTVLVVHGGVIRTCWPDNDDEGGEEE